MKRTLSLIILIIVMITVCGCTVSNNIFTAQRPLFCAVAEPLVTRIIKGDLSVEDAVNTLKDVGASSVRIWFESFNESNEKKAVFREFVNACTYEGIVIIGMHHNFSYNGTWLAVPDYDITKNSEYMKWMNNFENTWFELANEFPEVMYWETGNETNMDTYLHKEGYYDDGRKIFTLKEKAKITADMMFFASRGIHRANPEAKTIMPGIAPAGHAGILGNQIKDFLTCIYEYIGECERYSSYTSDDFFQIISWHAYYNGSADKDWIDANNKIYNVTKQFGDYGKDVFITEFGKTDMGIDSLDESQGEELYDFILCAAKNLPYVKMFGVFRLLNDPDAEAWGGQAEVNFGIYDIAGNKEHGVTITPKAKGLMTKEAFKDFHKLYG